MYFWDWKSGYNFQRTQAVVQPGSMDSEAGIFASTFDNSGSRFLTCEADKSIKIYKEDDTAVCGNLTFVVLLFPFCLLRVGQCQHVLLLRGWKQYQLCSSAPVKSSLHVFRKQNRVIFQLVIVLTFPSGVRKLTSRVLWQIISIVSNFCVGSVCQIILFYATRSCTSSSDNSFSVKSC